MIIGDDQEELLLEKLLELRVLPLLLAEFLDVCHDDVLQVEITPSSEHKLGNNNGCKTRSVPSGVTKMC